jgi:hypothetical protein
MKMRTLLCISERAELIAAARRCAARLSLRLLAASDPEEVVDLLAVELHTLEAVLVDFDSGSFAAAWVRAIGELHEGPAVIAVSEEHPRFLEAAAPAEHLQCWLRGPVRDEELAEAVTAREAAVKP